MGARVFCSQQRDKEEDECDNQKEYASDDVRLFRVLVVNAEPLEDACLPAQHLPREQY